MKRWCVFFILLLLLLPTVVLADGVRRPSGDGASPSEKKLVVVGITVQLSKLQEFGIRIPFFFYGYWPVREYG